MFKWLTEGLQSRPKYKEARWKCPVHGPVRNAFAYYDRDNKTRVYVCMSCSFELLRRLGATVLEENKDD